jgi:hypothetical protein
MLIFDIIKVIMAISCVSSAKLCTSLTVISVKLVDKVTAT